MITAPLRYLLKQGVKFQWAPECQQAFETLKTALTTAPVLALPRFDPRFILTTDAAVTGLVYILSQKDEGEKGARDLLWWAGRPPN
jgi:RNase H-like domain found in reverse transcriptase